MGFFNDLLNKAEDAAEQASRVASPAYHAPSPVVKPSLRAVSKAYKEFQSRVVEPKMLVIKSLYSDPASNDRFRQERGLGAEDDSVLGRLRRFVDVAVADTRSRQDPTKAAESKYLADLPWYENVALSIVADPTTYLGAGAVKTAAAQAAARGGIRAVPKAIALEMVNQTGVPAISKLPYQLTLGAAKGGRVKSLSKLLTIVDTEAAAMKDANAAKYGMLGESWRAAAEADALALRTDIEETLLAAGVGGKPKNALASLRNSFRFPDAKTLDDKYTLLASKLNQLGGYDMEAANFIKQSRRSGFTHFISQVTDANSEFGHRFVHQVPDASAAGRLINKVPVLKSMWNAADPSTLAALSSNPVQALHISSAATAEQIAAQSHIVLGHTSLRARQFGVIGDPITGLMRGVKKVGNLDPTMENILGHPEKFRSQLSPKQWDFVRGVRMALDDVTKNADAFISTLPESVQKSVRAKLQTMKWTDDLESGKYVPRIGTHVAPSGEALQAFLSSEAEPNVLRRIAARFHVPVPILGTVRPWSKAVRRPGHGLLGTVFDESVALPGDFKKLPAVKPALGAKQSFEYDRVLENTQAAKRVLFSHDPGEVLGAHMQQVYQAIMDEGITLPALKALGKSPKQIVDTQWSADLMLAATFKDKGSKALQIIRAIKRGDKVSPATVAQLRRYGDSGALSDDARQIVMDVAERAEQHLMARQAIDKAVPKVSRVAAKSGERQEALAEELSQARMPGADADAFPGPVGEQGSRTPIQAAPDIKAGQEAQELGAQVSGAGVPPPRTPLMGDQSLRKRVISDIVKGQGPGTTPTDGGPVTGTWFSEQGGVDIPVTLDGVTEVKDGVTWARTTEGSYVPLNEFTADSIHSVQGLEAGKADLAGAQADAYNTVRVQIEQQIKRSGLTPEMWVEQQMKNPRLGLPDPEPPRTLLNDAEGMRINMVNTASDGHTNLEAMLAEVTAEVKALTAEKARILKSETIFDMRMSKVPGLQGTYFDDLIGDAVNKHFLPDPVARDGAIKTAAAIQGIAQTVKAGQDFGVTFLQSVAALATNPIGWAKGLGYAIVSVAKPEVYASYLEGLSTAYDLKSGLSVIDQASRAKLALSGTELYAPTEFLAAIGANDSKINAVAEFVGNMPLNRAFAIQRNVASLEIFRAQVALEQVIVGRGLNDAELMAVGRQVNLATGVTSNAKLGVGPTQATVERLTGRFGVQWFRSQTGRLAQAVNGGMDGRVARRLLMQQMGAMTALYVAAATATQTPLDFDPSSRNFITIKVGNSRVSFGGIYPSMMRTMGRTVEAVATGNEEDLLDIKNGRNPLLNFWRNGAPLIGSMMADAVGVNKNTPYAKSPLDEISPIESAPFAAGAALSHPGSLKDRAIAAGATGIGLNESPVTATDNWNEISSQYAKEAGAPSWDALPKAVQDSAIRDVPELAEADRARQEWFDKHGSGSALSTSLDHIQRSKAAENDVLVALWAQVAAGTMDKSTFRQAYNDWQAKHAYFSDNLLASLPEEDKKALAGDDNKKMRQDLLAEKFLSIQPQDSTGTGTPSELDFKAWQAARNQFWTDNPEASQFREYILFDYPVSKWDSPITREAIMELKRAQDAHSDYLEIPKYKGMTFEEGEFFDQVLSAKSRASQELSAMAVQAGIPLEDISIPAEMAWKYTLAVLKQQGLSMTSRRAQLIQLAAVADRKPEVKLQIIDPRRFSYLRAHPEVVEWYPGAVQDTGIPTKVLQRLGFMGQPTGETVAERAQVLVG